MNQDRISQLQAFYEDDPEDPFNIYCLATEYKEHDQDKAWSYYSKLLEKHPDYLPTYYHAAELMIDKDEIDIAEKIIDDGIALAIKQNNQLALRELRNLLNNLLEY
jgi:lipoprotein NlpI